MAGGNGLRYQAAPSHEATDQEVGVVINGRGHYVCVGVVWEVLLLGCL